MKLRDGIEFFEIDSEVVVAPTFEKRIDMRRISRPNEVALFLLRELRVEVTKDVLIKKLAEHFDIPKEQAEGDVSAFLKSIKEMGFLGE